MRAVILAAGRGTRLRSTTGGLPKCLLPFGEQALVDYQIDGLFQAGVESIAILVGHERTAIRRHVAARHPDRLESIEFVVNPHYAVTNNMYSLWLARHFLKGEAFLCLNGDVLCHPEVLRRTARSGHHIALAIDREFREETTKVVIRNGRVRMLSKAIPREGSSGTFVNVAIFSPEGARALFPRAEALFAEGRRDQFFNDVIGDLAAFGFTVGYCDVEGLAWAEIDDERDLAFARASVFPEIESLFVPAGVIGG